MSKKNKSNNSPAVTVENPETGEQLAESVVADTVEQTEDTPVIPEAQSPLVQGFYAAREVVYQARTALVARRKEILTELENIGDEMTQAALKFAEESIAATE